MNDSLFAFCANIFGFIAGGISLLSLIVAVCRPHLPSNKIKILETLLQETETDFKEAIEAGLLVPEFIERTQENLTGLKGQTSSLRARAYDVSTFGRDYVEFLKGTSNAIGRTCRSLKQLRAEVITSSEERRRLCSNPRPIIHPALQPVVDQSYPTPIPPTTVNCPDSHLPAPLLSKSDDVQNMSVDDSGPIGRVSVDGTSHPLGASCSNPFEDP